MPDAMLILVVCWHEFFMKFIVSKNVWCHIVACCLFAWIVYGKTGSLRGLDTQPVIFFTREITSVTSCLVSCTPFIFWKGFYSKRKEFTPKWSSALKYYSFRLDSFFIRVPPPPPLQQSVSSPLECLTLVHIRLELRDIFLTSPLKHAFGNYLICLT